MDVQDLYHVYYLPSDFKKNKGMKDRLKCAMSMKFLDNAIVVVCLQL